MISDALWRGGDRDPAPQTRRDVLGELNRRGAGVFCEPWLRNDPTGGNPCGWRSYCARRTSGSP